MKYFATINYLAIENFGLTGESNVEHWILLDYLAGWMMNAKKFVMKERDREFVLIETKHLISELPLMKWTRKKIYKLLKDLEKFELIITKKMIDNRIFFALTGKALSYFFNTGQNYQQEKNIDEKDKCQNGFKHLVPYDEKTVEAGNNIFIDYTKDKPKLDNIVPNMDNLVPERDNLVPELDKLVPNRDKVGQKEDKLGQNGTSPEMLDNIELSRQEAENLPKIENQNDDKEKEKKRTKRKEKETNVSNITNSTSISTNNSTSNNSLNVHDSLRSILCGGGYRGVWGEKGGVKNQNENKKEYAELVHLTEEEYEKLKMNYGQKLTEICIEKLSHYKVNSRKRYKSDYRAILNWVLDEVLKKYFETNKYKFDTRREQIIKSMKDEGYDNQKIKEELPKELELEFNIF